MTSATVYVDGVVKSNCHETLSDLPDIHINAANVDVSKARLARHFFEATEEVLSFAEEMGLPFPDKEINLLIHPVFNFPGNVAQYKLRPETVEITVPFQNISEQKIRVRDGETKWGYFTKHPKHSLNAYYHEWGHALFDEYMLDKPGAMGDLARMHFDFFTVVVTSKQLLDEYKKVGADPNTSPELLELHQMFVVMQEQIDAFEKSKRSLIFQGMDELFADLTAVLITEDPSTMVSDVVALNRGTISNEGNTERDFAFEGNSIENFNTEWETEEHNLFTPVRYFLYDHYLRYPRFISGHLKSRLVKAVLLAIRRFAQIPEEELETMNGVEANQKLMDIIKIILPNGA